MMSEIDFIILNCSSTFTNMLINDEILKTSKNHYEQEMEIMKSILNQLELINERLKNGN